MKQDTWNRLEEMFGDAPILKAESVPYLEIDEAAKNERHYITPDYREFIHRYGGATVGPYSIVGLGASDTMSNEEVSAFELTKRFRSAGWAGTENWLIFSTDLSGNPVGIDASGEIWISDHENGSVEKLASNFEEYLRKFCLELDN
jgi:hypothetical protein